MNRFSFFCCIAALLTGTISGNPIDSRLGPFISEVFLESPTNWYIELDMSYSGDYSKSFPCSLSNYSISLSSSKQHYGLQLSANVDKIAIITAASLTNVPSGPAVKIAANDTITIYDSSKTYPYYWRFKVYPVATGHSLYNDTYSSTSMGQYPNVKETEFVSIGMRGNPPPYYGRPFISEVQIQDSAHWAIELNYSYSGRKLFDFVYPCTLSQLKLRVENSPTLYNVAAIFDSNKIAVLRSDNPGSPATVLKGLKFPTTLFLYDSAYDPIVRNCLYWSFYINKPNDSAHSWIPNSIGTIETIRSSIGTRLDLLLTENNIYFVNKEKQPVSEVFIYRADSLPGYLYFSYCKVGNVHKILSSFPESATTWWFSSDSAQGRHPLESSFSGVKFHACYRDSFETLNDTLILPVPTTGRRSSYEPVYRKSAARLFHVNHRGKRVVFSAVFPETASMAQLRIVSLNGALIDMVSFGDITVPGTYSVEWSYGTKAGAGQYICTLLIDGSPVNSQQIKIW